MPHQAEIETGKPAKKILDALVRSPNAMGMLRAFLAEEDLREYLQHLKKEGLVEDFWENPDGSKLPDFTVRYREKNYSIECKSGLKYGRGIAVEFETGCTFVGSHHNRHYDVGWVDILATVIDGQLAFLHERDMRRDPKQPGKYHRTQPYSLPWSPCLMKVLYQVDKPVKDLPRTPQQTSLFDP